MRAAYLGIAAVLALLPACKSDLPDVRPSPIPPSMVLGAMSGDGADAGASEDMRDRLQGERVIDGLVAGVGDRFLTRSEVMRRLRLDGKVIDDPDALEDEIDAARVAWAREQLFRQGAEQAGLKPNPRAVDDIANQKMKELLDTASEEAGRPVSQSEYLREKRLTMGEFRRQFEDVVVGDMYVRKLLAGLGPNARAEVDFDVSPAEVRRIYRDHRDKIDEPAMLQIAVYEFRTAGVADEDHTPAEWEALVARRAELLADLLRQGHDAKRLGKHFQFEDDEDIGRAVYLPYVPQEALVEKLGIPLPEYRDWIGDPHRQARDVLVLHPPQGPLVVGVLGAKAPRVIPFSEAHDRIEGLLRKAKAEYLQSRMVIEMIEQGSVVSPPELEDMLLDQAHEKLAAIAKDPVLKRARLR